MDRRVPMSTWQELATISHYQTAVAVRDALQRGEKDNAMQGLEELIDALARADRRALRKPSHSPDATHH
jgi:hypothetical protein